MRNRQLTYWNCATEFKVRALVGSRSNRTRFIREIMRGGEEAITVKCKAIRRSKKPAKTVLVFRISSTPEALS